MSVPEVDQHLPVGVNKHRALVAGSPLESMPPEAVVPHDVLVPSLRAVGHVASVHDGVRCGVRR